jgi:two-component system response regulator
MPGPLVDLPLAAFQVNPDCSGTLIPIDTPHDFSQMLDVLIIEDDPDDALLLERLFRKAALPLTLHWKHDGHAAREFLVDQDFTPMCPVRPSLIFCDLNMPRFNGLAFIQWLRRESTLAHVPVIVLTASDSSPQLTQARAAGATEFLLKPFGNRPFERSVKELCDLAYRLLPCVGGGGPSACQPLWMRQDALAFQRPGGF